MAVPPKHYTADERAKIFGLTYAERQQLGLRRTGSIDVDKAGRERARRDRYNAKRRVARQLARAVKAPASIEVPSSQKVVGKHRGSSKVRQVTPYSKIVPEERDWCGRDKNQERAGSWAEGGGVSDHYGHRDRRVALAEHKSASRTKRCGLATESERGLKGRIEAALRCPGAPIPTMVAIKGAFIAPRARRGRQIAYAAIASRLPKGSDATIRPACRCGSLADVEKDRPMSRCDRPNPQQSFSDLLADNRKVESDLRDQGIKLYPPGKTGERARSLWRQIKPRLLGGAAVEITTSALKLDWHREELRRARTTLVTMQLIKTSSDGRYVLGSLGPYSATDELIREQFFDLKLLEGVLVALSAIVKSQKPGKGDPARRRHKSAAGA